MSFYSPKHAVSSKRIAVSSTVTRMTAIHVEAPVSHHAPVAPSSAYSRFADAVSIGRVTRSSIS